MKFSTCNNYKNPFFWSCFFLLSVTVCVAQETNLLVKFSTIKSWEMKNSPMDTGYKIEPNWLKLPNENKPIVVSAVAVDSKDNIYIVDRDSIPSVICVNTKGEFQFQWKPKGLGAPHLIYCDKNDDLWISDIKTHQIHKLSKKGEVVLSIGVRNVNGNDNVHFDKPTDIDFLPDGNVLIADGYGQNKRVMKFDHSFNYLEAWGAKGTEPGKFAVPHAITVGSDGRVFIADRDAWRVQIFDNNGKLLEVWPHIGRVFDIVESANHHFFCLDGETGRITEVDKNGNLIGFFGTIKELSGGHGLAITSDGSILAAMKDGRVEKFSKK